MEKQKFRAEEIGSNKVYQFTALNYQDARHWVINHLDMSKNYCIVAGWKNV